MRIDSFDKPFEGERFRFTVTGGTRPVRIRVYIDRTQVLDHDCPDPPCHEVLAIPQGVRGSEISIIATDALGDREERRFSVGDYDTSGGGMMSPGA